MNKTQFVRVTRTIRQTYYVVVEDAASKTIARETALPAVDEWGETHNPETTIGPWVAASRDYVPADSETAVGVHAVISAKHVDADEARQRQAERWSK